MNDQILDSFLEDFRTRFGLEDLEEWKAFELFTSHSIISKFDLDGFEPDQVAVGGEKDLGLDGIGILADDHLVYSTEGINYFIENLRRLDVEFIFVQAKTSRHFQAGEIGTFLSGVRRFFDPAPPDANSEILDLFKLKDDIYKSSIHMSRNPVCKMFYVTTGTWNNDDELTARINQGVDDLKSTNLFSDVEFIPIDLEAIRQIYRELNNKITREIEFEKNTVLPDIEGVREAYIGIVPCLEYLKLICDDEGNLNRRLFYDNVRDFQGNNTVNQEIEATIRDPGNGRFALLNNGITVIAKELQRVGSRFRLGDFQVVNGCQTSHVLHRNTGALNSNIYVPFKLIVTEDPELTSQITRGANSQTEVHREAFESLSPFQKLLEEFYLAIGRDFEDPLYYERRSKQYDHLGIKKNRIITLALQINCFTAMFLNEPQSTHRYYGELLSSYRARIFNKNHKPMPYFVSGLALATLERMVSEGLLPRSAKAFKYQMLMVFRLQNKGTFKGNFSSGRIEEYCQGLLDILKDKTACLSSFQSALKQVHETGDRMPRVRGGLARTRAFTVELVDATLGKSSRRQSGQDQTHNRPIHL